MPGGNSDRCPLRDFGVAAQGKVAAYQFGVFLREVTGIVLRAVDKEATIVLERAAYAACCTFAIDGDNEDIFIDTQTFQTLYTGTTVSSCNCQGAGAGKGYIITV